MNSLKPSMLSECDLHCLDKICIWPLRLPLHTIRANIFRTRKNFPVSNADALTGFLALCLQQPGGKLPSHDFPLFAPHTRIFSPQAFDVSDISEFWSNENIEANSWVQTLGKVSKSEEQNWGLGGFQILVFTHYMRSAGQ